METTVHVNEKTTWSIAILRLIFHRTKGISVDAIIGFFQGALWVGIIVIALIIFGILMKLRYKVPKAHQALVITGGKRGLRVLPGRGAFVTPIRRKYGFFSLGIMTVRSDEKETQTSTIVPVVVAWTAQLRPDSDDIVTLTKAVSGFSNFEDQTEIMESLRQTLDGEVRAVVATMTPEEVIRDKTGFSNKVKEGVEERMQELGFKLVSLNIAEVTDRNGHYANLAAPDRESQRQKAETVSAQANQHIAVETARSDEAAKTAELERDIKVAEKNREAALRKAEIKSETDIAEANAAIAGQLQTELRNQELATREGEVSVIREQQRQSAAVARREVEITEAETARQRTVINAEAQARQQQIDADAQAAVAKAKATGEADAINATATAKADQIRMLGEAEAAAILAEGKARAEVERLLADAMAANDGVKLQVQLAEIQRDTQISVATSLGEVMANIGEKATFIDMGGNSGDGGGDLFTRVLGNLPELFKKLDVKSGALNGQPFGESVGAILAGITGGGVGAAASPSQPEPAAKTIDVPSVQEQEPAPAVVTPRPEVEPVPVADGVKVTSGDDAPIETSDPEPKVEEPKARTKSRIKAPVLGNDSDE